MVGAFLILLREGFEAALIVGIILAVLARMGEMAYVRHVLAGVGCALVASVVFALTADGVSDLFGGAGQEVVNGVILGIAAAMITYVMVWLRGHQQGMQEEITSQVYHHVKGRGLGVFVLAFVSVFREGVETVLFMWGVLATSREGMASIAIGGLLGLLAAVGIAWLLFQGGRRVPMRLFFNVTTGLLVVLAAGMLARGVGYFVAVDMVPALVYSIWDTGAILSDHSAVGGAMAVLIGYNANPTLMEVLVYGGYLSLVGLWLWFGSRKPEEDASTPSPNSGN